jgi:hypothetical protein
VEAGQSQEQIALLAKWLWNRYEYGLPESPMRMAQAIVGVINNGR